MAPVMLAVEPRIKAAVVTVAGLRHQTVQPEADPFNYLPRVTLPVLMLNGRYDFYFPVETSQRPYFDRLGTPLPDKAWMVYDGSHSVPSTQVAKESLAWFDRYLDRCASRGGVRRPLMNWTALPIASVEAT